MSTHGIRLLFRCKLCKSVENIENFSEHKKQAHLTEFQKMINTFVVFEEICIDGEVTALNRTANNTFITTSVNSNQLTATVATASLPSYQNVKFVHYETGEVLKIKEEPADAELNSEQTSMHFPGPNQPEPDDSIASSNFADFDVKNEKQDPHRPHVDTYDDGIMLNSPPVSVSSPFSVNQNYSVSSSTETDCETDTITEALLQYKCKLCSKLFNSEPHVKLHVGICQLYNQNPQNKNQNRHEQNPRNVPVPILPNNLDPKSRPCTDPDPDPFSVFAPNFNIIADPSNPMQIKNQNQNQTQYNLNPRVNYSGNEYAKILKKQNQFIFHNLTPKAFKDKKSTPRKRRRSPKPKLKPKHGEILEIPIEDKNVEPTPNPKPPNSSATLVCAYCSQTFIRKCNLEQHLRTHHSNDNNVVFKCQVCEFTSQYPLCIAQHMSAKHGNGSYYSIDSNPLPLPLIPQ